MPARAPDCAGRLEVTLQIAAVLGDEGSPVV